MLKEGNRMAEATKDTGKSSKGGRILPHHHPAKVGEVVPNVINRLHSQVHVCNHARCASNNPNYNVKAITPPKKFLVAKKHLYGGLHDDKHTKSSCTTSTASTSSSDHALHSLTNNSSVLQPKTNSVLQPKNGKGRSTGKSTSTGLNGLKRLTGEEERRHSVVPHSRVSDSSRRSEDKESERKVRPTFSSSARAQTDTSTYSSSHSSTSGRCSSVVTASSQSTTNDRRHQKSRLGSAASPTGGEEDTSQWEDLSSPKSSITSVSITQIISTLRGDEEEVEGAPSPTASVGSNHGPETPSLKDPILSLEAFEQQSLESSPGMSESLTEEAAHGSPTPSVAIRRAVSESPTSPVTSISSTSPQSWSLATSAVVGEGNMTNESPTPSVAVSESPTSTITSDGSKTSPTSESSNPGSSTPLNTPSIPLSTPLSSSASEPDPHLKENSNLGSANASVKKPSKISRTSVSILAPLDSSPLAPIATTVATATTTANAALAASRLTKKCISDMQTSSSSAARRAASTKGVRSIELKGGKAQSYSTTTVTTTTTTVETSQSSQSGSNSVNSPEKDVGSGLLLVRPTSVKPPWQSSTKEGSAVGPDVLKGDVKSLKFGQKVRKETVFDEVHEESETVALKHGEVAERRLSEEWMTNHALEGVVKKISDKDHRVKILVHAFETLATLAPDSEGVGNEDNGVNAQLEFEVLSSAAPIAA